MADNILREWGEKTLPTFFHSTTFQETGIPYDPVDFALTQVGANEATGGDDKFIEWYNTNFNGNFNMAVPWCSIFVSWCLAQAGSKDIAFSYAEDGLSKFLKVNRFKEVREYTPQRNDVFFVTNNSTRQSNRKCAFTDKYLHPTHVGLVIGVNKDEGYFTSVEGNYSDSVKLVNRYLSSPNVVGFGINY